MVGFFVVEVGPVLISEGRNVWVLRGTKGENIGAVGRRVQTGAEGSGGVVRGEQT